MEKLKTLLIANRGEIAVRITRTAKALGIHTISIYSAADAASSHVTAADEAVLLSGNDSSVYTDGENIIAIAKQKGVDAIIPGYGFLSENAEFARQVADAGIAWVGPSPEAIEAFGVKHVARDLAEKAGVPIVPGTKGLVESAEDAVRASEKLGFPVMLKATGGGGGMGLVTCYNVDEVRSGFDKVQSRGKTLFKNSGLFIERYYAASRHIEVQVFGNGQGSAIHFGERECSIQRRHQKVIEECPSPFVEKHSGLREKLGNAAVSLAESIKYGSAGTVEYLVDDESGDYFFLEMNTRLQVEHGITELCYDVDLVELMLQQADAQLNGQGGLKADLLKQMQPSSPKGSAIEARVYAENPLRDFAPSPGLLQSVSWPEQQNDRIRIDTWVFTGATITPNYDPLIAKVMFHGPSRNEAVEGMQALLSSSKICGPPTNLDFLEEIIRDDRFKAGNTLTNFLDTFDFRPAAIDVISAGAYTLIQDLPARPTVGKGIPHSGAMDSIAFSLANILAGNSTTTEALEITLSGPELHFVRPAVVALTGAPMDAQLDGQPFSMWQRYHIKAGQKLKIGKTTGSGCRAYLAVYGGFPTVAKYFGSKSTSPIVAIGGYQGRQLAPGDLLAIVDDIPESISSSSVSLPTHLVPVYTSEWEIMAMVGPHDIGYLLPEDIDMIYTTTWKVSHNASRSAIRLIGPVPKWARKDGGEGGAHPSNLVEYGYPIGALNWTGDDPCLFPVDCPNFGGFVSSTTVIRAEWWKLGQLKSGDTLKYKRVSLEEALSLRKQNDQFIESIENAVKKSSSLEDVKPLSSTFSPSGNFGKAVIWERSQQGHQPQVRYRQGGDDHIIVEYGNEEFDLNHRCRTTALEKAIRSSNPEWLNNTVSCCTSVTLFYNGLKIERQKLVAHLQGLEDELGDLSSVKVPCRKFRLPLSFESKAQEEATKRYMETQRPHAPYLPSNFDFVAKNNAFTSDQLRDIFLTGQFMAVVVGFYAGNTVSLPVDPRQRMSCPKANPSRVFTPEGTVSWGGSCMSIYPVDSPGGYQMTGRTIPIFDALGWKNGFSPSRPYLFQDFDILTYYRVSEEELDVLLADFRSGRYKFEWEDIEFDMAEHNKLLADTAKEVERIRAEQAIAQAAMTKAENESLAKWREEKAKNKVDDSTIESMLTDPKYTTIDSPVAANVWKIMVEEKQTIKPNQTIAILEAMKLEIAVNAPTDQKAAKVERLLVAPGETVNAGAHIALLKFDD
ncbi:3-methylcrotonyl-CoA carboxylase subunit alpha, partial [Aureobasidium melanogenum]